MRTKPGGILNFDPLPIAPMLAGQIHRNLAVGENYGVGHFRRDDRMYGTRLPKDVDRGQGWSGRRLGIERYGPVGRIWQGAPLPLKATVAGASTGLAVGTYDSFNEGLPR